MFHYDMNMWNFGYNSFNPRSMSLAMIQDNTKTELSRLDLNCIDPEAVKDQKALFWQVGDYLYYYNKTTAYKVTEKVAMDESCAEQQMIRFSDDQNQDNKAVFKIAKDFGMDLDNEYKRNIICVEPHVDENGENYKPKPVDNCSDGWGEVEGKCYRLFTEKAYNQPVAVNKCEEQGAELYRPKNQTEETKVTTWVQGNYGHPSDYFIGILYDFTLCFMNGCVNAKTIYYCGEERGKQKCGQRVGYHNWDSGQPDGWTPQHGVCITKRNKWDNCYGSLEAGSTAAHAYLCQKSI